MAVIRVETTRDEQLMVLRALKDLQDTCVPVNEIAKRAGLNPNRVRYVISDLLESGEITREATKAYNKHYVRYKYFVTEKP